GSLKMSGVPVLNQIKASGGLLLDARPEAQINILQKNIPGIEADFDDEGVPFVRYKGQEYYLNKPELSFADVTQFLGDAAAFLPASKAAGLGKTAMQRFGVGAATYGATSAGMDVAGNLMGSEQGIDPIKAGVSAVLGGAAEAVTPYVIQGVRRLVGSRKLYRPGEGLTDR